MTDESTFDRAHRLEHEARLAHATLQPEDEVLRRLAHIERLLEAVAEEVRLLRATAPSRQA